MSGIPSASSSGQGILARYLPFAEESLWVFHYQRSDLPGDLIAGLVVAILLVPQSMAYALLAGLPPQVGLYASILPVIVYGLLGSSRALAVGPVAIISLLVAAGLEPLAGRVSGTESLPGSPEYGQLALGLALEVGLVQGAMGLLRLGFLANFLSHTVVTAFGSAAALIIGFSQLRHLLGVKIANTDSFLLLVQRLWQSLDKVNWATFGLGLLAVSLLVYAQRQAAPPTAALGCASRLGLDFDQGGTASGCARDQPVGLGPKPLGEGRGIRCWLHSFRVAPLGLSLVELGTVDSASAHRLGH
jgi:SulP family sulfate permease